MEYKKQFKLFNRLIGIIFSIKSRKLSKEKLYGFANKTQDNMYVIFIDYDIKISNLVKQNLREIQRLYCLSDFYLFETNRGYHAICLDKVNLETYLAVLNSSFCCNEFKKTPLMFGHNLWTLRLTAKNNQKPKYIYTLKSMFNCKEKSQAHINIIKQFHKIKVNEINADNNKVNEINADNNTAIIGAKYPNA